MQMSKLPVRPAGRPIPPRAATAPARQAARLASAVQRAREQEREHQAREFHDVLGGVLTAARLQVACLKSRLAGCSGDIDRRLEHLNDTLGAALALKRRIIDGLDPASLHGLGLATSLDTMVREFVEGSGIHLTTDLDEVAADEAAKHAIYRLVQEALTNMVKHAAAGRADIVLRDRGSEMTVFVSDDGSGFDPARAGSHGHGLDGMRHRVESAGGRLTVHSSPGRGTRISATLPKQALAERRDLAPGERAA